MWEGVITVIFCAERPRATNVKMKNNFLMKVFLSASGAQFMSREPRRQQPSAHQEYRSRLRRGVTRQIERQLRAIRHPGGGWRLNIVAFASPDHTRLPGPIKARVWNGIVC